MLVMFLVVALAMGHVTARLRAQGGRNDSREERATSLYLLTRELAPRERIFRSFSRSWCDSCGIRSRPGWRCCFRILRIPGSYFPIRLERSTLSPKEHSVAAWAAHRNAKPAGRSTDTLPSGSALHLPLNTPRDVSG